MATSERNHRGLTTAFGYEDRSSSRGVSRLALGIALGSIGLLVVVAVVALFLVQPSEAIREQPFGGSYVLNNDSGGPVVVDLASGAPTIRLVGIQSDVSSASPSDMDVSPLNDGWLLLNTGTGNVNFLDRDNLVLGPMSGLDLPGITSTASRAVVDGSRAFVIRGNGRASDVVEVSRSDVALAAQLSGNGANHARVHVGEVAAPPILSAPGDATGSHGDLWAIASGTGVGAGASASAGAGAGGKGDQLLSFRTTGGAHRALAMNTLGSVGTSHALATDSATGRAVLATDSGIRTVGLEGEGALAHLSLHGAVTSVVPVASSGPTQWFLYREGDGWRAVGFDTLSRRIVADRAIGDLHASDVLSPVSSGNELYAMSANAPVGTATKDHPVLFSTSLDAPVARPIAVPDDASGTYPAVSGERPNFAGESVVVAGPRVIFNNPDSELAVMVFLDGHRQVKVIDKFAATTVDPGSLLTGLASSHPSSQSKSQAPGAPAQTPQQVDQHQMCKSSKESPHVPTIDPLAPGANSVLVSWTYPLLDAQDCQPSSYEVDVTPLNGASAPPNGPFFVNNGATQFDVTGLESQSQYQVVVTAFINRQSTSSLPASFTTTAGAPAAPTNVTTVATGTGWDVSWTPCGGNHCGKPLAFWNVTSTPCGSSVVINPPEATGQSATATSVSIPFSSSAPPGTSLSFSVAGGGEDGSIGTPANDGHCTEGWSQPRASQLTFSVSYPNPASNQVVLSVSPPPSASTDAIYGSTNTSFTWSLIDNTNPSASQNPLTSALPSQTFSIVTGDSYTADVTVTPTGHTDAAVTLPSEPVAYNSPWPGMSVAAAAANGPSYDAGSGVNVMTAVVTVADAFANNPNNKSLTLAASGSVVCAGNSYSSIASVPVTPTGAGSLNGTFAVTYSQPTSGPPPSVVGCNISNLTLTETDSSNVHTSTSPALNSSPFASGDEAFSASFATAPNSGAITGITLSINGTGGVPSVGVQLGGTTSPQAAGSGACTGSENAANGSVVGRACAMQLQAYANTTNVSVTWSPSLLVSWADGSGQYSQAVPVPCGGACPSFSSMVPSVTGVSPSSGTSSTVVTISGTNFTAGATVEFAKGPVQLAATNVKVLNGSTITANPPTGPMGTTDVVVTVNGLSSAQTPSDQFTYKDSSTTTTAALLRRPARLGFALALATIGFPAAETRTRR